LVNFFKMEENFVDVYKDNKGELYYRYIFTCVHEKDNTLHLFMNNKGKLIKVDYVNDCIIPKCRCTSVDLNFWIQCALEEAQNDYFLI